MPKSFEMELKVIAHIENGFGSKFGVPRQSGLCGIKSRIVFEPEYASPEAFRGIEQFSHLFVIWGFSEGFAAGLSREFSPTVRPPRLGGNKRLGVFATRSPNRPNPIGLSVVKLLDIGRGYLTVSGGDMANGTPVYDIKPYLRYADCVPEAVSGYADAHSADRLKAEIPDALGRTLPEAVIKDIKEILENDPRPQYRDDGREYFFEYAGYDFGFRVEDGRAILGHAEKKK